MSEGIRMHEIETEFWTCGKVDPALFVETFEYFGFWEEDFPADGMETMCGEFGEMGIAAWARFMDLTIRINAGELNEVLLPAGDGEFYIPHALIEAAAVTPMAFEGLQLDLPELLRETMRRLAILDGPGGELSFEGL